MNNYVKEINKSMRFLSKNPKVLFLGQSVLYPGSSIYVSLNNIKSNRRIELPVFEETQMGMTLGLALEGYIPVSCFPRFDFLILALNQLINHIDKIDYLTNNQFKSKIIIRTMVGARKPLNAGPQHCQNHTQAIKKLSKNIKICLLDKKQDIFKSYSSTLKDKKNKIFLFVEDGNNYI
jgi:pyruvate/2-oxoglutarate/acetoin dehydrogenase E1 component